MTQTVPLSILLKADGSQAVGELRKVSGEAKSTTAALTDMGSAPVQNVVVPLRQTALAATGLGNASGSAAQHVTQLGYQFNDIAMMLAAGQNPFMLMMQQGTQVTQIFSQMRASGLSLRTVIGASLVGMVNPANLATMAVIGLGAAAVQYFTDAGEAADSFGDAAEALKDNVDGLSRAVRGYRDAITGPSTAGLSEQFGSMANYARETYDLMARMERVSFARSLQSTIQATRTQFKGLSADLAQWNAATLTMMNNEDRRRVNLELIKRLSGNIEEEYGLTVIQATRLRDAMEDVQSATSDIDKARALERLGDEIVKAGEEGAKIPDTMLEVGQNAISAAQRILEMIGAMKSAQGVADGMNSYGMTTGTPIYEQGMYGSDLGLDLSFPEPDSGTKRTGKSSGRSGKSEAARDAESVQDLIQSQRDELDILRATNPVQAEMLRYRRELAAATPKQREEIEQNIIATLKERQAVDELNQANAEVEASFREGFVGLITGADSFGDARCRAAGLHHRYPRAGGDIHRQARGGARLARGRGS